jgi:hypothetical protein
MIVMSIALTLVSRRSGCGRLPRDSTQIRGIHQSWLIYARDFGGQMPTPSLVDRLTTRGIDRSILAPEGTSLNTTANLNSMCVMQNHYSPDLCVGPTEPSARVMVCDQYNYNCYAPANNVYWDSAFKADLRRGSHTSYAHMPLFGHLRTRQWRDSLDANWPIVGNRGPLDGVHDPKSYTLQIHPPNDQWAGNVCFNDNHMESLRGLSGKPVDPNIPFNTQGMFRYDGEDDADGILTFTKAMTPDGPVIQHD